jgi:hypothetical protein
MTICPLTAPTAANRAPEPAQSYQLQVLSLRPHFGPLPLADPGGRLAAVVEVEGDVVVDVVELVEVDVTDSFELSPERPQPDNIESARTATSDTADS